MKPRAWRSLLAAVLAVLASPWVFRAGAADPPAKGVLWETTSQPSMEGMPMQLPANTVKVCVAKESTEPPGASTSQGNCKNTHFVRSGDKVTWDVQCSGPTMTGTGEIVYAGKDSYSGAIRLKSEQGNMTVKLSGRKLGGECDNPR
jgi:Protein of unknown function (DUF3617)